MSVQVEHLFKIGLFGNSYTGKTSIINILDNKPFNEQYRPSINSQVHNIKINVNGVNVNLEICDKSGQSTNPEDLASFYQSAHAIVLVYDLTRPETLPALQNWKNWHPVNNNTLFFLMGTKKDLSEVSLKDSLGEMCQNNTIQSCFELSVKEKDTVISAFQKITQRIMESFGAFISD